jgi:UDP-3-O-[3-hydroxymyristoyl] glucosamine N-acyltransferase
MKISWTASLLADRVKGKIIGDGDRSVVDISDITEDRADTLSYLSLEKVKSWNGHESKVVLMNDNMHPELKHNITYILVPNVDQSFKELMDLVKPQEDRESHICSSAMIHDTVEYSQELYVGAYAVVQADTKLGSGTTIGDHVSIGRHVTIGSSCIIHPGVRIHDNVRIGDRCIIYSNAVIGFDGFGHHPAPDGYQKIRHIGTVHIEDDVEIGSNTCIDRGRLKNTIIRKGVKLDNLIQVAHGVEIDHDVVIAAQAGISGSTYIGPNSRIGGQVGMVGHISVAEGSQIQAQSGLASSIKTKNKKWYGTPAMSYFQYLRSFAIFKRLPEILERLNRIERNR